ncbi:MAG: crossover junction endodeoxyribonuclease RuvC [Myxococcales bacterium]|nr:crossover junction endodeoxyribonuclease RuvC [Myxococcales bacterium]
MTVRILGIDTGYTATGLALVEHGPVGVRLVRWMTVKTAPTPKKRRLLVVDDHLRRIREIRRHVIAALVDPRPDIAVLEAFSQHQNAASAARQAFGYATAVVCCEDGVIPIVQWTPQEIHRRLGVPKPIPLPKAAPKGASREEKRAAERAREEAREANKRRVWETAAGRCSGEWGALTEHEADAACAALAALFPEPVDVVRAVQAGRAAS